ncbi:hypothetical protein EV426DRAFT_709849 [Tirmania nivea]|nr:hypothetical protein EV426DRAFT_709849 [Tirmania nivea]
MNPYLGEELDGTIYKDVQGFDKLFHLDDSITLHDMETVMEPHTFTEWLRHPDLKTFERNGVIWFNRFNERMRIQSDRFYYCLGALRKSDIVLTRKLADPLNGPGIEFGGGNVASRNTAPGDTPDQALPDNSADSAAPHYTAPGNPEAEPDELRRLWKDILVIGKLKADPSDDLSRDTILQTAHSVQETFAAQPGRRFVHAFTVCGHVARFWFFDRVGVSISTCYNISTKPGQNFFMRGLHSYMKMTASRLGFDERYKDISGDTFLPNIGTIFPAYLHLEDKVFKLVKVLYWSPDIVTRGTLCWLAKEVGATGCSCECGNACDSCDKMCVVKEAWRDSKLAPESQLWQLAKEKDVLGCLDVLIACEADIVYREIACGRIIGEGQKNIRNCFNYTRAELVVRQWGSAPSGDNVSGRRTGTPATSLLPKIHSGDEDQSDSHVGNLTEMCKPPSTKPSSSERDKPSQLLPRRKGAHVVEARTRSFMVLGNVGGALDSGDIQLVELVEVLRDAIRCHRSLYEKAGILHCDISLYNVMRTCKPSSSGLKGFLIDLDHAHRVKSNLPDVPEMSSCVTGTAPSMALDTLQDCGVIQAWRQDLEGFLYVLVRICVSDPQGTLESYVRYLSDPLLAVGMKEYVMVKIQEKVVKSFREEFLLLKELVFELRDIIFYKSMDPGEWEELEERGYTRKIQLEMPADDDARVDMYNRILKAFENCAANLAVSTGGQQQVSLEGEAKKSREVVEGSSGGE